MAEDYVNGMVRYTSRDYESLMNDFWDTVPKMTELWKPEAPSDPGVVLGKFLASVADMLGVNIDYFVNELYAPSVSQRKNAEKIFSLIGYELGWYTAARTEVTFRNTSDRSYSIDFGFNGNNFTTVNAYTDITNKSRVITYNILPLTNAYGSKDTRSRRRQLTEQTNLFTDTDEVILDPGESVTRVAIEGELRSYTVSVQQVKKNNYIINLPSQHVDTSAVWIKAKTSENIQVTTQWIQCINPAEFITPEPRFCVSYDSYSNAQIQVSNYLNQLENYENNFLIIYWIDCSGLIGCVGENVLSNVLFAKNTDAQVTDASGDLSISNLSNTLELPHTNVVVGASPETAREAYYNSRKYINTFDSLVTLPDFNRFLIREPGVDCGLVIDCQKALDINMAIYEDTNLTDSQKSKMYITNYDFPIGDDSIDWTKLLSAKLSSRTISHLVISGETLQSIAELYSIPESAILRMNGVTSTDDIKPGMRIKVPGSFSADKAKGLVTNFKTYTGMCFAVHNDFQNSSWGNGELASAQIQNKQIFTRYKPPIQFIDNIIKDYRPLQNLTVELEFGFLRVFDFNVVGQIYPKKPVTIDVANNIILKVKQDLALFFAPANRQIGDKPTVIEIVNVIRNSDSRIDYFDAGNLKNEMIHWRQCDIEYFNPISFARYINTGLDSNDIRIAPEYIVKK